MTEMTRSRYVAAIQRYFEAVMAEDLGAIRECFTADARVTILHGDSAQRQFHFAARPGEESVEDFYGHIWRHFHIHFGQFTHVVDLETTVCSAIFVPTLTPKVGAGPQGHGVLTLRNCNFFWFQGAAIRETVIYYANPELGARLGLKSAPATVPPR